MPLPYENATRGERAVQDVQKILRELARIEAVRLPVAFVMPASALTPAVLEILRPPEIPAIGELAQANALLEHAMDHASKHGSEDYASGKAGELLALFARVIRERDEARAADPAHWPPRA
jgi:hypothetical protein